MLRGVILRLLNLSARTHCRGTSLSRGVKCHVEADSSQIVPLTRLVRQIVRVVDSSISLLVNVHLKEFRVSPRSILLTVFLSVN